MGREIRLILSGIANSLNPNGYYNVVTPPRKLNETATKINSKRKSNYKKLQRQTDERISGIAVC